MSDESLSTDTPANNKFAGIFGLVLGIVSGYLSFYGEGVQRGLGIMTAILFGGITAGFFIYFLFTTNQLRGNANWFLGGAAAGFFIMVFIINLILFPSIFE